jgi:large subunit ribosomal protein L35
MPKNKSHKGLLKRVKITKSGKIKFKPPRSRHLKSNKTGLQVQSYRKSRHARSGDMGAYEKLLFRGLRSQEQHEADDAKVAAEATAATDTKATPKPKAKRAAKAKA